jgi:acetolactate synthase-1/2/3 large subunit
VNNADLIVATLHACGVRYGFGIPSGNVLPLMDSMRRGGIEFVLTAHEGSAAFAADVMGRQTGIPGLAIATLGPGATNLATGVGDAYLDRSPMLAITCNIDTPLMGRRIQMAIDHHALFAPITKGSFPLRTGTIVATVQRALALACTEPVGPVHLDLPEDVATAAAQEPAPCGSGAVAFVGVGAPASAALEKAREVLAQAKRPIAIIGASAMRLADHGVLTRFIESNDLLFASTTMAKGLIDEAHPLSIGCIERAMRQRQREFVHGADLIVGVGYDPIEVEYEVWVGNTPVLHLDIEKADTDGSVTLVHEVVGDLGATLGGLSGEQVSRPWSRPDAAAQRASFQASLRPASDVLCPHQVIDAVRDALSDDGVLSFDVGAHTHQIASQWCAREPRTFLITNGWSSMGFGLPAAIAAKLAAPERPVVCVLGDGCFQMTCGELATAKRLGISLPVVVLDDGWLGLIKVKQERRGLVHYGTELDRTNVWEPPAHYFGVPVTGVSGLDALRSALTEAFDMAGPSVIEARVDPTHYSQTVFD